MRISIQADDGPANDQIMEVALLVIVASIPVGGTFTFDGDQHDPITVERRHGEWAVSHGGRLLGRYTTSSLVVGAIIRRVTADRDVTAELLANDPTVCEPATP